MAILRQGTGHTRMFKMILSSDHITLAGSRSPTVRISKAGTSFSGVSGSIKEVANGWYAVLLNSTDLDTEGDLAFYISGSGADDTDFIDQVSKRVGDDFCFPTVSGRGLDVSTGGEAGIDWANIGSPTTAQNLSSTNIDVDQVVASVSGSVNSVVNSVIAGTSRLTDASAAGIRAFFLVSGTGYPSSVAGSVVKEIADNAGGSALTQQGIVDGVWNEARNLHTTAGSFGEGVASVINPVISGTSVNCINLFGGTASQVVTVIAGGIKSGQTFNLTGDITGNLSGSVGSVTGAVGSVTGAVGSVAGNVDGNVTGSVGSVLGNVDGNVTGSVGSVVGNVSGSVNSVVNSVTAGTNVQKTGYSLSNPQTFDLTGNITGNLSGSVNSIVNSIIVGTNRDKTGYSLAAGQLFIKKNTALANFMFLMLDSTDHVTPKTGLTITSEVSIDGGAFTATANSAAELSNGIYVIDFDATDTNGTVLTFKFNSTGADTRYVTMVTQT